MEAERRRDLTHLEFVSIDASKTQDIDDALYAEISDDGWTLFVAIADPTAYIDADSKLRRDVADRSASIYFHGDVLPMLPEAARSRHLRAIGGGKPCRTGLQDRCQ